MSTVRASLFRACASRFAPRR
uniref:Uncharacterized protein n=1 Tax=Arundo donax TaxID=35708 RepID=A0A0A8YDA2_ARUDO